MEAIKIKSFCISPVNTGVNVVAKVRFMLSDNTIVRGVIVAGQSRKRRVYFETGVFTVLRELYKEDYLTQGDRLKMIEREIMERYNVIYSNKKINLKGN